MDEDEVFQPTSKLALNVNDDNIVNYVRDMIAAMRHYHFDDDQLPVFLGLSRDLFL